MGKTIARSVPYLRRRINHFRGIPTREIHGLEAIAVEEHAEHVGHITRAPTRQVKVPGACREAVAFVEHKSEVFCATRIKILNPRNALHVLAVVEKHIEARALSSVPSRQIYGIKRIAQSEDGLHIFNVRSVEARKVQTSVKNIAAAKHPSHGDNLGGIEILYTLNGNQLRTTLEQSVHIGNIESTEGGHVQFCDAGATLEHTVHAPHGRGVQHTQFSDSGNAFKLAEGARHIRIGHKLGLIIHSHYVHVIGDSGVALVKRHAVEHDGLAAIHSNGDAFDAGGVRNGLIIIFRDEAHSLDA